HLARKLTGLGHDARLMPAKYVRPYAKGQKNDFNDAEAIAEAVQRPTAKRARRIRPTGRRSSWWVRGPLPSSGNVCFRQTEPEGSVRCSFRPLRVKDRDRGTPRGVAPPTPPGIRVRTTAVRPS